MDKVANIARHVYKSLGPGYSERVYHNAMEVGLRNKNISYDTERVVNVLYEGHVVGNTRADLVVENDTVVELKAIRTTGAKEINQLERYLKVLHFKKGILINFPPDGDVSVHTVLLDDKPHGGQEVIEDL